MNNSNLKSAKILVVDDNLANIELLEMILENTGFENVKSTTDSLQVIDLYNLYQPDLILLDLMMPHKNGFEVMEDLKNIISPTIYLPILVLTADLSSQAKQKALSSGAKDFISKPFDLNEVIVRINNLLETRYLYQLLAEQNNTLAEKVKERTQELEKAYHEIKLANQELEVLEKAKIQFLSIISHEIRTPLNGIIGFTGILKGQIDSPQLQEYINYLEISIKRLEQFSYKALLITELRTRVYPIKSEDVSIYEMFESTNMLLQDKLKSKNIITNLKMNDSLFKIWADKELVQLCFECLIDNSIKYSHENNPVTLQVSNDDKYTYLEFIDNGVGFSEYALQNPFKYFGVGEKHIDKNAGLNMALIKLIMESHGGEISVFNNNTIGATVKLKFKNH